MLNGIRLMSLLRESHPSPFRRESGANHPVPIKGAADLAPRVWRRWWAIIYAANEWEIDRAAISNLSVRPLGMELRRRSNLSRSRLRLLFVCLFALIRARAITVGIRRGGKGTRWSLRGCCFVQVIIRTSIQRKRDLLKLTLCFNFRLSALCQSKKVNKYTVGQIVIVLDFEKAPQNSVRNTQTQ